MAREKPQVVQKAGFVVLARECTVPSVKKKQKEKEKASVTTGFLKYPNAFSMEFCFSWMQIAASFEVGCFARKMQFHFFIPRV